MTKSTNTIQPTAEASAPAVDPRIERTRAVVAAAAADLFLTFGPDAITHGRVASKANVSRTTVYKHWPERADLLRSTIDEIDRKNAQPTAFTGALRGDLRLLLGALARKLNDDNHARAMAMMIERAQHDPTVTEVRDTLVQQIYHMVDEVLRPAIVSGDLRTNIDIQSAAGFLGGSLLFARFLGNRTLDEQLLNGVVDDFIKMYSRD